MDAAVKKVKVDFAREILAGAVETTKEFGPNYTVGTLMHAVRMLLEVADAAE